MVKSARESFGDDDRCADGSANHSHCHSSSSLKLLPPGEDCPGDVKHCCDSVLGLSDEQHRGMGVSYALTCTGTHFERLLFARTTGKYQRYQGY